MNQKVLDELSLIDWDEVTQKMTAVSIFWAKVFFGSNWNHLPKGFTIEDTVQESIRRAFVKDWESYDSKVFEDYLFGAVKSNLSNLKKSSRIQKTSSLELFSDDIIDDEEEFENKIEKEEVHEKIRMEIRNDSNLSKLFESILQGSTAAEAAKTLGVTDRDVYNLKKRLVRVVEKVALEI
jgi:DNA-directed RNA polymerase specialized sigma24 family protein